MDDKQRNERIKAMQQFLTDRIKKWHLWFIFLLTVCAALIVFLVFKDRVFSAANLFQELIIDQTAADGTNRTGEWNFFWRLLWLGCFLAFGLFLLKVKSGGVIQEDGGTYRFCYNLLPLAPAFVQTVLFGKPQLLLLFFSMLLSLLLCAFSKRGVDFFLFYLVCYFDCEAIYTLFCLAFHYIRVPSWLFPAVSLLAAAGMIWGFRLWKEDKKPQLSKGITLLQLPLPLLILVYLKNSYVVDGKVIQLSYPGLYVLAIGGIILLLYISMIRYKQPEQNKNEFLFPASAIAVFLFRSYIPAALFVQTDMHHHGEQLLAWQQIVDLSQKAFVDYAPVSGLFPLLIGAINHLLGGSATSYAAAFVLLFLLFAILTMALVCAHIPAQWAFLLAFLFAMPCYCRTWMILPSLLLIFLPRIHQNRRHFLFLYVLLAFLGGLYYPLFGFAFLAALFPYALLRFCHYIKSHELMQDFRKPSFYVQAILLLLPILCSTPLLFRMAGHILAYSHQTVLADGLSLASVEVPEWFLPYLSSERVVTTLYEMLRFLFPMLLVWGLLLLLMRLLHQMRKEDRSAAGQETTSNDRQLLGGLSCILFLLPVCYSYTMVIMDEDWVSRLFSRSSHVFLWVFGFFLPVLLYTMPAFKKILSLGKRVLLLTISLTIPFLCFYQMKDYQFPALTGISNQESETLGDYEINLAPFTVPESMCAINKEDQTAFPRLGNGFISRDTLTQMNTYAAALAQIRKADPKAKVLGLATGQMYYFLLDEPAVYSGKPSLAKSHEAQEAVNACITEHTIVGSDIKPLNNYEIYINLRQKGYLYDEKTGFFLPKEIYTKMYTAADAFEVNAHSPWGMEQYIGKIAGSLGNSHASLSSCLRASKQAADFLYVEIDEEKLQALTPAEINEDTILSFTWGNESSLLVNLVNGKLLLPLGTNAGYNYAMPDEITVGVYGDETAHSETLSGLCTTWEFEEYR